MLDSYKRERTNASSPLHSSGDSWDKDERDRQKAEPQAGQALVAH